MVPFLACVTPVIVTQLMSLVALITWVATLLSLHTIHFPNTCATAAPDFSHPGTTLHKGRTDDGGERRGAMMWKGRGKHMDGRGRGVHWSAILLRQMMASKF